MSLSDIIAQLVPDVISALLETAKQLSVVQILLFGFVGIMALFDADKKARDKAAKKKARGRNGKRTKRANGRIRSGIWLTRNDGLTSWSVGNGRRTCGRTAKRCRETASKVTRGRRITS